VRAILPQLTRTVQAADELMQVVGGPARRIAPNLVPIVDTLGSPAFTTLPTQLAEFMRVMGDVSRRLGPLAQFAESAGGMFGFRMPGSSRSTQPPHGTPLPLAIAPEPSVASSTSRTATPRKLTAKKTIRKTTAKKTTARQTTATKTPAKRTAAKKR
jgi:hypothetical protein